MFGFEVWDVIAVVGAVALACLLRAPLWYTKHYYASKEAALADGFEEAIGMSMLFVMAAIPNTMWLAFYMNSLNLSQEVVAYGLFKFVCLSSGFFFLGHVVLHIIQYRWMVQGVREQR